MPKSAIGTLILELAKKQLEAVNFQTGNHNLSVPYLGQVISLEMIIHNVKGDYHAEVLNHFFV